jgi:hypothetical protein
VTRKFRTLAAASAATLLACAPDAPTVSRIDGECADAFGAEVCTWAVVEGDAVVEVGATVPLASVEGAPADAPFEWPPATAASIALPEAERTGLTHMTVNWEAMGHPPETFLVPHFDFHFYMISSEERMAIDCTRLEKPTDVPEGYVVPDENLPPELAEITGVETLIGVCVPEMGMHALNAEEMASTEPFTGTMIVGYYDERPIFVEPMIAQSFLTERRTFDVAMPAVPGKAGPTAFRAEYDEALDAYRFVFSGFGQGD